jgi:hypothetical protein
MDRLASDGFCGLSTGLECVGILLTTDQYPFSLTCTGLFGWEMIYVSFVEILSKARISLVEGIGETGGHWLTAELFSVAYC